MFRSKLATTARTAKCYYRTHGYATYLLADSCHGSGGTPLAKAILGSSSARLAAATQSVACAADFKHDMWDGDRLLTSTVNLTCESDVQKFVAQVQYSLSETIDILLANVGEVPGRWRTSFNSTPLIPEVRANEWIRLCKDVAGVGILLKNVLPTLMRHPTDHRKVVVIFTHQAPLHCVETVALKSISSALDELVASTSLELARKSPTEFVTVKVHTPNLESNDALAWGREVVRQIGRLRLEATFASTHDGQHLPIPGYPDKPDTFWYGAHV